MREKYCTCDAYTDGMETVEVVSTVWYFQCVSAYMRGPGRTRPSKRRRSTL